MSAMFELPISSETLTPEELTVITGGGRRSDQINWLDQNGWTYHKNRAGEPIVGRLYARLKLAGLTPATLLTSGGWQPDYTAIQ